MQLIKMNTKITTTDKISSVIHKIFGIHAASTQTQRQPPPHSRTMPMPSTSPTDPNINRINSYWFADPEASKRWFQGGPTVDDEIRSLFGSLVEEARASKLTAWTQDAHGTLALLLLLDQFPRNIFRGSPLSYTSDQMAAEIATEAIAKGFDRRVEPARQPFFYLPLMHGEDLKSQVASMSLCEGLAARCAPGSDAAEFMKQGMGFARSHMYCIMKFGRFPSRNEILGRKSTAEEIAYLKRHPSGFWSVWAEESTA